MSESWSKSSNSDSLPSDDDVSIDSSLDDGSSSGLSSSCGLSSIDSSSGFESSAESESPTLSTTNRHSKCNTSTVKSKLASALPSLSSGSSDFQLDYVCELSDELQAFAQSELGETAEVRTQALREMYQWISTHADFGALHTSVSMDTKFLLRFLRSQKFNVQKACRVFDGHIKLRQDYPAWFQKLSPDEESVASLARTGFVFVLPERDVHSRKVLVNYASRVDVSTNSKDDIVRLLMMTVEALMCDEENQIRGISYLFYCKDLTMSHISVWTPADAVVLIGRCEKNMAIRHSSIACVSMPFAFRAVLHFVKQFLSVKIRQRIAILSAADDMTANVTATCSRSSAHPRYAIFSSQLPLEMTERRHKAAGGKFPFCQTDCASLSAEWLNDTLAAEHVRAHFRKLDHVVTAKSKEH